MDELRHTIEICGSDSRLATALGSGKLAVNSFHHQGGERLAPGLVETAKAQDGLNEAYEGEGEAFLIGAAVSLPEALSGALSGISGGVYRLRAGGRRDRACRIAPLVIGMRRVFRARR